MRLGILISGGGTTFENLQERIRAGGLAAEIACVISSRSGTEGVAKAKKIGYPVRCFGRHRYESDLGYSQALTAYLVEHGVELVVLAGFLRKYLPQAPFRERCLNIHPALLPAFGGKGFYGMAVHEAVWRRGCKVSGCTVHLVTEDYDAGPIVLQRTVALDDGDTPEDIRRKVFEAECEAYPEAIRYFAEGRVSVEKGRVRLQIT